MIYVKLMIQGIAMDSKLLIFGTGDLAEVLYSSMEYNGVNDQVAGFVVDDEFFCKSSLRGKPVYKYSCCKEHFSSQEVEWLIAVGYNNLNQHRERIFYRLKDDGWRIGSYVDKESIVRTSDIGEGTLILEGVRIGAEAKIGKGNIFYPGSLLAHHSVVGDFNFFAIRTSVAGLVTIGNNCFFGNNSCTRDKIKIADKTLIGAGCYIADDVEEENRVYIPARTVRLEKKL